MIYIPKFFTLKELLHTDQDIQNIPTFEAVWNLAELCHHVLDPLRAFHWKTPIRVNSGYRNKEVNDLINGAKTSQHLTGNAADITAGSPADNKVLFDAIVKSGIKFDQLIDEKDYRWVHISYTGRGNRQQVLHLK